MWDKLRSIWTIPDLRNKILFTLMILLITRVLANIPVPLSGSEYTALTNLFSNPSSGNQNLAQLLGLLDVFSGGSLSKFSIVALGVYPYITATIVMQLLMPIIPALENMNREGEAGQLKVNQITRIITVPLAFLQALGQCAIFVQKDVLTSFNLFDGSTFLESFSILLALTAGVMIMVWLGELITENGIGNGISLIIFAGIVSGIPSLIATGWSDSVASGGSGAGIVGIAVFALIGLVTIVGIVYMYLGQRRVPIEYPTKRMVGRGLLVGTAQRTYIPMQVNSAGMIPLIFAQSMLIFPTVLSQYLSTSNIGWLKNTAIWVGSNIANPTLWYYWAIYFVLVVAFTYFYAYVVWQQQDIPNNLQKQGAHIPGYRPGETTRRHLNDILNRITLAGALFLGIVAILPFFANVGGSQLLSSAAVLIAVGVVLDTVRQIEAQMVMRNYSGFLT
ncbi:MAG TPA: preprotein translocase subunit SecY [Ktedonobacteraceae bacterium]|nr:preprotein translocase subunit SecY [Ktedonobacteraceae bacterium]